MKKTSPTVTIAGDVHGPKSEAANEHTRAAIEALAKAVSANAEAISANAEAISALARSLQSPAITGGAGLIVG